MKQRTTLFAMLVLVLLIASTQGQEVSKDKGAGSEKPAAKVERAAIAKLIEQLGSRDFRTREKASQQLAGLDDVPEALRQAAEATDPEVARRARAAISIISNRAETKAFEAMARDLHKVELDGLVRRLVAERRFTGEAEAKIIQGIAHAVTAEASKAAKQQFGAPEFAVNTMRRVLWNDETKNPVSLNGAIVLSAGPTPRITSVSNSLVIVDGDFAGATGISRSLLIVRGNVGRVTSVRNSIVLATGNWEGATSCDGCFVQVSNPRLRFTTSRDCVLFKTEIKTTGPTNSQVLNVDKGPLHLLKFSARPADAQLVWGKEVNGLAVAITPAERQDHVLIRWKNVGKDVLGLPWVRMNSGVLAHSQDDLLGHVVLKGPNGKLAIARQYPAGQRVSVLVLERSVLLGPGQTHEETVHLWSYVEKPADAGKYRLSIELNIPEGRRGRERDVPTWSGTIQSNVIDVPVGK